ncbi:membrane-spanning 4-domains subfamily A member 8-like [Myripristis murdjan]|uniref:membrane-spanning 4-domains subfamily A member 8-like n=1 Tax=Myripristis murdjan TaxID=586833 RepID=UPI0011760F84|nr:membrane-spanning 4-domains subfamily A member 8-like [Myripristis murdjan]
MVFPYNLNKNVLLGSLPLVATSDSGYSLTGRQIKAARKQSGSSQLIMSASVASSSLAGVTVITQVYPAAPGAQGGPPLGPQGATQRRLLALGTVQIMIGLLVLLFGIGMVILPNSIAVYSGIFVWGAVFYILAGSLTVAATRSMDRCKVNAALTLSIIATLPSGVAIILHFIDTSGLGMIGCYGYYDCYEWQSSTVALISVAP